VLPHHSRGTYALQALDDLLYVAAQLQVLAYEPSQRLGVALVVAARLAQVYENLTDPAALKIGSEIQSALSDPELDCPACQGLRPFPTFFLCFFLALLLLFCGY
jgi:hypothetical protein